MNFPQMYDLQQMIKLPISPDTATRAAIHNAIYTAVVSGLSTSAAITPTSGVTPDEMSRIFKQLGDSGLAVVNSGSTFTVGWGSEI